jgi:hypothetical protein
MFQKDQWSTNQMAPFGKVLMAKKTKTVCAPPHKLIEA